MLETTDAVFAALRENDARPYGRTRTVTAEELVDAADQFDDTKLKVLALLELMEAYEYDGEARKAPVVFARVLKFWDSDPQEFSKWAAHQVFWRFKWVAAALLGAPEVPLAAIRRWHEEMRERYTKAGHGLQPYYAEKFRLAAHLEQDRVGAFELWATRWRTELSDCAACETRTRALHHVALGDDARALAVWEPVLSGDSGCTEEPYTSHGYALLPLLRQGRTDQARSSHLTGYRYARGKAAMAGQIGLHLEFCALSGNEPRGLEILAENRELLDRATDPLDRLGLLTGVEVLLARLVELGHGELAVAGPAGRGWTVAELLREAAEQAGALAARFDERNGTDAVTARRRARLARRPLLAEPLALGVRTATALAAPERPVAAAPQPPELPEDLVELVLRARELERAGDPQAERVWLRVDELVSAPGHTHPQDPRLGPAERLHAELVEQRAYTPALRWDLPGRRAVLTEAQEAYQQAGLAGRALSVRAQLAVLELGEGDGLAADWALLDELLAEAEALRAEQLMEPDDWARLLQSRAYAAHSDLIEAEEELRAEPAERFAAAVAAFLAEAERLELVGRQVTARQYLANAAARQERFAEAEQELALALELIERAGLPWRAPLVHGLLAQVKLARDEREQAVELLHRALAEASRLGLWSFPYGPSYALLGHALGHLGDTAGAVRALSEAADRFDRDSKPVEAADVRLQLAEALTSAGRGADAVAVLESVLLDSGAQVLGERRLAQVRLQLARGLAMLAEYREAAEEYLLLADQVSGWGDDPQTLTMVACESAVALAEAGRLEAAEAARERAMAAHAVAPLPGKAATMLRELARAVMEQQGSEGLPTALAHLAAADEVGEQAQDAAAEPELRFLRASVHDSRARALATGERTEEALAEAELAAAAFEAGGAEGELGRAEAVRLAAVFEHRLGRTQAARERLAAGERRVRAAGHPEAAEVLADLAERLAQDAG
ncbi:hypothetical protein C7C46_27415 [Streptomyces tateyamensis]|uniref:Tetratricopeptide repeat protein n=1 Tax=Streptomyces tateyamensis TaxID=565073 RepID=A0A2V4N6X8_9ACTN|nr:hypothetical protein [Streptomyces tateyamensis]PYC70205.1 hypothetical protein C7C46_27415 [Streptomyces tateyamensis]